MSFVDGPDRKPYNLIERLAKPDTWRSKWGNGGAVANPSLWRSVPDNFYDTEPFGNYNEPR